MKSQNFEFLRARRAVLADLGGFAEQYAYSDPSSSLIKQRGFIEQVVIAIYESYGLPQPYTDNLNDVMQTTSFTKAVPEIVQQKLHAIRIAGNQAAHPRRPINSDIARDRLFQLFEVAQWLHVQVDRDTVPAKYKPITPPTTSSAQAKEALEKLRLLEAKHDAVVKTLEAERTKRVEVEQHVEKTEQELLALKDEGKQVASILHFNEETTRKRLLDELLLDAGWNVGANGVGTEQVGQEIELTTKRTDSGKEYADYVLYGDNGKPLAVVEVKRTSKDPKVGAVQARLYADSLESMTGQRPVIFFSNGMDIFLWDDAQGYPDRRVRGFYSKDSLKYLLHQRSNKKPLVSVEPNLAIADRMYQLEAVKRVSERFGDKRRKALLVQATGTGKTRVAISLCDLLMRAGYVKRILFLCDRRELRKQADRVFKEFMPGEPRIVVDSKTSSDRDKRIYLATYPAMMKCYEDFDVGFFDLIVADESHRSIYKKFRALFQYFDALEVGLTATPVGSIERNTYDLFDCQKGDPTSHYSFEDAVKSIPPYLTSFRVLDCQTWARKEGIKYTQMNESQREQLEDQVERPEEVDHEPAQLDRKVFNKDTTRAVWRLLMRDGIRESTGTRIGKTIVFARSHVHAMHMIDVFQELYPQYGSSFCRVIDNQEARAEQLIEDFKDKTNELTIAISVDMLDTGIDVPEVVNLVLAKPVKSYVKFWQMIGRGTRLCKNLFGTGRDKTEFLIFDHWRNFWFFDEKYKAKDDAAAKRSLLQQLFETRIAIAEAALDKMLEPVFQHFVDLIVADIGAVKDTASIDVKDHWKTLEQLSDRRRIAQFSAATKSDLLEIPAPLMQWRSIRGEEDAYRFDVLMSRLALEVLKGGPDAPRTHDLKGHVEAQVELLMKNQNPVKAKADAINRVRDKDFWAQVTVPDVELLRTELRGIMRYQEQPIVGSVAPLLIDIIDGDVIAVPYTPKLEGLDLVAYRQRVEVVIRECFSENAVLQRVRAGKPVQDSELEDIARLVLQADDKANIRVLAGHDPQTRRTLLTVFRSLVGLDPGAVEAAFTAFVHKHPQLSAQQLRFLQLLKHHIAHNGGIEIERLYEPPFTTVHAAGIDGVFPGKGEADDLFNILLAFEPKKVPASDPPPAPKTQQAS